MKLCIECKTILEDNASFCTECGCKEFMPFATKHCAFCNAEIANGTVICPHCHRIQPPDKLKYNEEQKVERIAMQKIKPEIKETEIITSVPTKTNESTSYVEHKVAAKSVLFEKKEDDDKPFVYRSPFEKIKDEPKDKKQGKDEVILPKEIKSDAPPTVIYNNYYTLPANMKSGSVQITVSTEDDEPMKVNTSNGAPKIESLFDDVKTEKKGDSYVINMTGKVKTQKIKVEKIKPEKAPKPKKEPKPKVVKVKPPKPVYGMKKSAEIISIIALIVIAVGFVSFMALPFIKSDVMLVSTIPAALSKLNLPDFLSVYSNFDAYASHTMISGLALEYYNYLPYLILAQIAFGAITLILVFGFNKFKPYKKVLGIILLVLSTITFGGIAGITYYAFNFNFDRVSLGVLIALACNVLATILIAAGYKGKKLTEKEIEEKKAKEIEEIKAKEEKRIAKLAKKEQKIKQKEELLAKKKAEKSQKDQALTLTEEKAEETLTEKIAEELTESVEIEPTENSAIDSLEEVVLEEETKKQPEILEETKIEESENAPILEEVSEETFETVQIVESEEKEPTQE